MSCVERSGAGLGCQFRIRRADRVVVEDAVDGREDDCSAATTRGSVAEVRTAGSAALTRGRVLSTRIRRRRCGGFAARVYRRTVGIRDPAGAHRIRRAVDLDRVVVHSRIFRPSRRTRRHLPTSAARRRHEDDRSGVHHIGPLGRCRNAELDALVGRLDPRAEPLMIPACPVPPASSHSSGRSRRQRKREDRSGWRVATPRRNPTISLLDFSSAVICAASNSAGQAAGCHRRGAGDRNHVAPCPSSSLDASRCQRAAGVTPPVLPRPPCVRAGTFVQSRSPVPVPSPEVPIVVLMAQTRAALCPHAPVPG